MQPKKKWEEIRQYSRKYFFQHIYQYTCNIENIDYFLL